MTARYRFRRKTTGYGWTIITREAWLVTLECLLPTAGGIVAGTAALPQRQPEVWLTFGCYAIAIPASC